MLIFGIKGMACGPAPLPSHPPTRPNSPLHGTGGLRPPSLLEEEDYQRRRLQRTMGLATLEVGGEEEEEKEFGRSSTAPMDLCPQEDSAPALNLLDPAQPQDLCSSQGSQGRPVPLPLAHHPVDLACVNQPGSLPNGRAGQFPSRLLSLAEVADKMTLSSSPRTLVRREVIRGTPQSESSQEEVGSMIKITRI